MYNSLENPAGLVIAFSSRHPTPKFSHPINNGYNNVAKTHFPCETASLTIMCHAPWFACFTNDFVAEIQHVNIPQPIDADIAERQKLC